MNTVELSVRSKLLQIVDELNQIAAASEKTADGLNEFSKKTGDNIGKQVSKTEEFLGKVRSLSSRVAKSMGDDFKALFNLGRFTEGLRLSNTFRENITESVELANTIRKLGDIFGISQTRFTTFHSKLTDGLGQIGASSEAATNALKGLSETQVRGEDTLLEYSKNAAMLASLSRTQGKEGDIAKGVAGVITQRGGNSSDVGQMRDVVDALKKQFTATGKSPLEILSQMQTLLEAMPKDLRKSLDLKSLIGVGVAGAVAGPNATKFLVEFLGKSPVARKALEARGFGAIFTKDGGFDTKAFQSASKSVFSNFGQDPRLMAQSLGLSEDAAEGFVRLSESLDKISEVQAKALSDNKSLERSYFDAMTAGEAFTASLNKFKSSFSGVISTVTEGADSLLKKAFNFSLKEGAITKHLPDALTKNIGATAVVAGGGLLAAMLAGGGIKGLMKLGQGKAQGLAERAAYEAISGDKVQSVYVTNTGEIGKEVSKGGVGGMGILGKLGLVASAGLVGVEIGEVINDKIEGTEIGKGVDAFFEKLGTLWGEASNKIKGPATTSTLITKETPAPLPSATPSVLPSGNQNVNVNVDVKIESKTSDLKATVKPVRGMSQ